MNESLHTPEEAQHKGHEPDRRGWLQQVIWYGVIAVAALWAFLALRGLAARQRVERSSRVILGPPERFRKPVTYVEAAKLFVFQEPAGFRTVTAVCTHLACIVAWKEEVQEFHCPCHDSRFDRNGLVLSGPAPRPLDWYGMEEVEGKLVADLSTFVPASVRFPAPSTS